MDGHDTTVARHWEVHECTRSVGPMVETPTFVTLSRGHANEAAAKEEARALLETNPKRLLYIVDPDGERSRVWPKSK